MAEVTEMTPYEKFISDSLEADKKELELLNDEFKRAGILRRRMLSSRIAKLTQNIQILSSDLSKYGRGLSWLREPTKERDEKAEHLGPVDVSAIIGQAKPAVPAPPPKPIAPVGARVGSSPPSVGVARPTSVSVGTKPSVSVGTKPVGVGTPTVGTPRPSVPVGSKPTVTVGKPKTSTPLTEAQPNANETQSSDAESPKPLVAEPGASQNQKVVPAEAKPSETKPKPNEKDVEEAKSDSSTEATGSS